jgi:hypothetical protein
MTAGWGGRLLTSRRRRLPDFLIVGGQRCGTTSLYTYLIQHPEVEPAFIKETHFFDRAFHRGAGWYRAFFPMLPKPGEDGGWITGEATPYYLFDPHVPRRVGQVLPDIKLIILLRNPVDRAYSHFQFESRVGIENLDFESAVERELASFPAEEVKVLKDPYYKSDVYSRFSYLARGLYLPQIKRWRDVFNEDRFLIIKSEDLYRKTGEVLREVFAFLGIGDEEISDRKTYNASEYLPLPDHLRARLVSYFTPHNRELYEFLGRDFLWDLPGSVK